LGGNSGGEHHGGEGEFAQSFHRIDSLLFVIGGDSFEPPSPATSQTAFGFLQQSSGGLPGRAGAVRVRA
jgi:hypothetical protein